MVANLFTSNSKIVFLYKLIRLIIILFTLDFSIGHFCKHLYFSQKSGLNYRTTYALEKTNEDMLIFGSSRANHHYNPQIFTGVTGLSCYNVGRDGQSIFYHHAVQKATLTRYKPKIIILDVVFTDFESAQSEESLDRLAALLPYYKTHKEIQNIVNQRSKFEKFKLWSKIYPYNSLILTILKYNFIATKQMDLSGYIMDYRRMNLSEIERLENNIKNLTKKKIKLDKKKMETIRNS